MRCGICNFFSRNIDKACTPDLSSPIYKCTATGKIHSGKDLCDVDFVPVVQCKDCKYYWKNSKYEDDMDAVAVCLASPKDDAFCSEGERKDE